MTTKLPQRSSIANTLNKGGRSLLLKHIQPERIPQEYITVLEAYANSELVNPDTIASIWNTTDSWNQEVRNNVTTVWPELAAALDSLPWPELATVLAPLIKEIDNGT